MGIIQNVNAAKEVTAAKRNWEASDGYLVTFAASGPQAEDNFAVCCNMQEKFSISLGAQWGQPFAKMAESAGEALGGSLMGGMLQMGAQSVGLSGRSKLFSASVWESTSALGFSLPLQLRAFEDEKLEVRDKLFKLLSLCAPSEVANGALLQAPGPTIVGNLVNHLTGGGRGNFQGRRLQVQIGNFLYLDNVIAGNISGDIDMMLSSNDIPLAATVNIDIATFYASCTVQDLKKIFYANLKLK